jgi:hypothetical protein
MRANREVKQGESMPYYDIKITHRSTEYSEAFVTVQCDSIEQAEEMAEELEMSVELWVHPEMWHQYDEDGETNAEVEEWDGRHDHYRLMPDGTIEPPANNKLPF